MPDTRLEELKQEELKQEEPKQEEPKQEEPEEEEPKSPASRIGGMEPTCQEPGVHPWRILF